MNIMAFVLNRFTAACLQLHRMRVQHDAGLTAKGAAFFIACLCGWQDSASGVMLYASSAFILRNELFPPSVCLHRVCLRPYVFVLQEELLLSIVIATAICTLLLSLLPERSQDYAVRAHSPRTSHVLGGSRPGV